MTALNVKKLYSKFRDITESVARLRQLRDMSLSFLPPSDKLKVCAWNEQCR